MQFISQSKWVLPVVVAGLVVHGTSALATDYPKEPVTVIVPFAPGGSVDVVGRLVSEALSNELGQQFIVENRPGAAGNIGYAEVARADKDGYTLLLGYSSASTCNPALFSDLNWNSEKDFEPIAIVTTAPMVLAVTAKFPAQNMGEFIEYAKAHPGELNYGSSGVGSQAHLGAELLGLRIGAEMTHVPYKGSGDLLPDLISGVIDFSFGLPASFQQYAKAGSIRVLASTGAERDPTMPDVPVMAEVGVEDLVNEGWHGLFAPAGTSPEIIDKLAASLEKITSDKAFVERAFAAGNVIRFTGPAEAKKRIAAEIESCAEVVKAANISL